MLDDSALDAIAGALADAQVRAVTEALGRILERWPVITAAVVAGLGDFIAVEAAGCGIADIVRLADRLGESARTAPAAAVAWLLCAQHWKPADDLTRRRAQCHQDRRRARGDSRRAGSRVCRAVGCVRAVIIEFSWCPGEVPSPMRCGTSIARVGAVPRYSTLDGASWLWINTAMCSQTGSRLPR